MTAAAWLAQREPPSPESLARRMGALLAGTEHLPIPDALLVAAEARLSAMLHEGETSRAAAADLLAVDALVTYAFEAASSEPERLAERAARAEARISRLAGPSAS
jgi:hypothetical protein